jgi:hypothetical protein
MKWNHGWALMGTDKKQAERIIPHAFIREIRGQTAFSTRFSSLCVE